MTTQPLPVTEEQLNTAKANCKQLGIELVASEDIDNPLEIIDKVRSIGYVSLGYFDANRKGGLVALPPNSNKYNNGIYMLIVNEDNLTLEVIVPNTADKQTLITQMVNDISNFISTLDTFDLDTYDWAEIFGFVISRTALQQIAETIYTNETKQKLFRHMYIAHFLTHVSKINRGDEVVYEEAVNTEPYILRDNIEEYLRSQSTDTSTDRDDKGGSR